MGERGGGVGERGGGEWRRGAGGGWVPSEIGGNLLNAEEKLSLLCRNPEHATHFFPFLPLMLVPDTVGTFEIYAKASKYRFI